MSSDFESWGNRGNGEKFPLTLILCRFALPTIWAFFKAKAGQSVPFFSEYLFREFAETCRLFFVYLAQAFAANCICEIPCSSPWLPMSWYSNLGVLGENLCAIAYSKQFIVSREEELTTAGLEPVTFWSRSNWANRCATPMVRMKWRANYFEVGCSRWNHLRALNPL